MSEAVISVPRASSETQSQRAANDGAIAKVVYRSRASRDFSVDELRQLTLAAQSRNHVESITGLMLYADHCFYQWLEGPAENVSKIMHAIRNDERHTDVQVLEEQPASMRRFGDWTMKLAAAGPDGPSAWRHEVIEPPSDVIETLRQRPEAAPSLLIRLIPANVGVAIAGALEVEPDALGTVERRSAAILRDVFLTSIVPHLADRHGVFQPAGKHWPVHARAAELVDLLLSADATAAQQLIKELRGDHVVFLPLLATLFEPAARRLGDLWNEDDCSDADVTIGLSRLQMALRLLSDGSALQLPKLAHAPVTLIVPEPGELHRIGAALDSTVMSQAGWQPRCEYPVDDAALADILAGTWFDTLDLSLSTAFRREHLLPRMTETIALARRASCNPALVVVVGGRVFVEEIGAGNKVGADVTSTTSLEVNRSIIEGVRSAQACQPKTTLH